jgi:hypothetical protein
MSESTLECCHCHKVGDITILDEANFDLTENIRQAAKFGVLWCVDCSEKMERLLGIRR